MQKHIAILILAITVGAGQPANAQSFSLSYPGYRILIAGGSQNNPDASQAPLVSGKLDTLSSEQRESRFGLILGRDASQEPVLEVIDAASGAVLVSLVGRQMYAPAGGSVRPLPARSVLNDSTNVAAFEVNAAGGLVLFRTIATRYDQGLPNGRALEISWSVESGTQRAVRARFRAPVVGTSRTQGSALIVSPASEFTSYRPSLIVQPRGDAQTRTSRLASGIMMAELTSGDITATPGSPVAVLSLRATGTTATITDNILRQTQNTVRYLQGQPAAADMITVLSVDKPQTRAGDTLTYRIVFRNIGTGPAENVVLTNPVNAAFRYIDGSVTGDGAEISFEQSSPEPPSMPVVQGITWKFMSNILPGEERWVSFKARVQ